jgi:hypothetical protein
VRCHKNPPNIGSRGAYVIQRKVGNKKGRDPPEDKDASLCPC